MPRLKKVIQPETPEEAPVEPQTLEEILVEGEELKAEQAEREAKEAEAKANEEEVEVDLDQIKEDAKTASLEAVKEATAPLVQEIQELKKAQTPEEKDEYDKFVEDYTEKNGKAPEWKQVAVFLKDQAKAEIKAEQDAIAQEEEAKQTQAKQAQEEQNNKNFEVWQSQLAEMETQGLIPKMENKEEGDPGFDARIELYAKMQETWKTGTPLVNMYEVLAKNPVTPKSKEVPGADAPVSMGRQGGAGADGDKELSYDEIHNISQDLEGFMYKQRNGS